MTRNVKIHPSQVVPLPTPKTATQPHPQKCPYCPGRLFLDVNQLLSHANVEHVPSLHAMETGQVPEIQRFNPRYPDLLLQPDSRPISQEQLASEVKSIYAGLTALETECIRVAEAHAADPNTNIGSDRWQELIVLHRALLHEHHDFFLASQHPSASPTLRRLASKYTIPTRMWKHGIYSFLELLRRGLPESIDYMLAFIYLSYQIIALLCETVPVFKDTWIECLGDLGRYRVAIECDVKDRKTWAGVARSWYNMAADKNPSVGRLYHHLAILARPNALQQLYYYSRSLTCVTLFPSARISVLKFLDSILSQPSPSHSHSFIRTHGILFKKLSPKAFNKSRARFLGQLNNHISCVSTKWKEQGVHIAVTNISGLFNYGSNNSGLRLILEFHENQLQRNNGTSNYLIGTDEDLSRSPFSITEAEIAPMLKTLSRDITFSQAYLLMMSTLLLVVQRIGDENVLPHVHVLLSFLSSFASIKHVAYLVDKAPWSDIVTLFNTLLSAEQPKPLMTTPVFPVDQVNNLPLPEDYQMRGQIWSQWHFPENWFLHEHDEDNRCLERASTVKSRTERILHLGYHLSTFNRWISYNQITYTFSVLDSNASA